MVPRTGIRRCAAIATIVVAVTSGSCSDPFPVGTPCELPDSFLLVCLRAFEGADGPPRAEGTLLLGAQRIEGLFGGNEWRYGDGGFHGDPALPLMSDLTFVDVDPGVEIHVAGNADSVTGTLSSAKADADGYLAFGVGKPVAFRDARTRIEADPGRYVLSVRGIWAEGEQTFWFGLRVVG